MTNDCFFETWNKRVASERQWVIRPSSTVKCDIVFLTDKVYHGLITIFSSTVSFSLFTHTATDTLDDVINVLFCYFAGLLFSTQALVIAKSNFWQNISF